ncbi:MAG: hypothetical protein CMM00_06710 [Rhodopirellula sp.]|nr:hypothetical protein [Rhodopirellula sp.]
MESGLMDYCNVGDCYSLVEIAAWSAAETQRAIDGRRLWGILGPEQSLWSSADELISKLQASPNMRFDHTATIRDEWDGHNSHPKYSLRLPIST